MYPGDTPGSESPLRHVPVPTLVLSSIVPRENPKQTKGVFAEEGEEQQSEGSSRQKPKADDGSE